MYLIKRSLQVLQEEGFYAFFRKVKGKLAGYLLKNKSVSDESQRRGTEEGVFVDPRCEILQVSLGNNPQIETLRLKTYSSIHIPLASSQRKQQKSNRKVAVILHLYYEDLAEEIIKYMKNLPLGADIYISTTSERKKEIIQEVFAQYTAGHVDIRVCENRGRDIAPFILNFKDVFNKYEYILHLHGKRSKHSELLGEWRQYLFENLIGSKAIVESILELLDTDKIGIVCPVHCDVLRGAINWGANFASTNALLKKMGGVIGEKSLLDFPSGSMFWCRAKAIVKLTELNLELTDFEEEAGQVDGTLAHSIERSFFYVCEISGYTWVRVTTKPSDGQFIFDYEKNTYHKIADKIFVPLLNRYYYRNNVSYRKVPEQLTVNTFPEYNDCRPRLNLLVPTLYKKHVFGGISTALKLFDSLRKNLTNEWDFRLIVTDTDLSEDDIEEYQPYYNGVKNRLEVVSVSNKNESLLKVRKNDVFIATAWWTAIIIKALHKDIKRYHCKNSRLFYLVQDYEPNFYPWSTKWEAANSTYQNDIVAIINSEELATFFREKWNFQSTLVIPYSLNDKLKEKFDLKKCKENKKKKLLFYGRPTVDRNCFDLIIDGIAEWQNRNPTEAAGWQIISAGESFPESYVKGINNLNIKGRMDLDEYAEALTEASVGISLMLSPHPSYPPLEMAYYGLAVVTNKYCCKDLTCRSKNFVNIKDWSAEGVANAIEEAVKMTEKDLGTLFSPKGEYDFYSVEKLRFLLSQEVKA